MHILFAGSKREKPGKHGGLAKYPWKQKLLDLCWQTFIVRTRIYFRIAFSRNKMFAFYGFSVFYFNGSY